MGFGQNLPPPVGMSSKVSVFYGIPYLLYPWVKHWEGVWDGRGFEKKSTAMTTLPLSPRQRYLRYQRLWHRYLYKITNHELHILTVLGENVRKPAHHTLRISDMFTQYVKNLGLTCGVSVKYISSTLLPDDFTLRHLRFDGREGGGDESWPLLYSL